MKYKICWKNKITKLEGESEPVIEDEKEARIIAGMLNDEWPELEHWAVGVEKVIEKEWK